MLFTARMIPPTTTTTKNSGILKEKNAGLFEGDQPALV